MNTIAPGTYEWLRFQATNLREHGLTNIGEGIERAANRMKLLEAQNARLREALEFLLIGYEGLGGDMENNAPREAKAALADGKAAP